MRTNHGVVFINLNWGPHAGQKIQRTGRVSIIKSWTGSLTLHASGRGISSIRADERHGRRAGSAKLRSGPRGPEIESRRYPHARSALASREYYDSMEAAFSASLAST